MQILKKIFLDNQLKFFTSSEELHYLSKFHIYSTNEPLVEWRINHLMNCQEIVTQVFCLTNDNPPELILPDSVIHPTPQQSVVSFSEPQAGFALLVCPKALGQLDWAEEEVQAS